MCSSAVIVAMIVPLDIMYAVYTAASSDTATRMQCSWLSAEHTDAVALLIR
jgi:hypothetical protein